MYVTLVTQHALHVPRIAICDPSGSAIFFRIIS